MVTSAWVWGFGFLGLLRYRFALLLVGLGVGCFFGGLVVWLVWWLVIACCGFLGLCGLSAVVVGGLVLLVACFFDFGRCCFRWLFWDGG